MKRKPKQPAPPPAPLPTTVAEAVEYLLAQLDRQSRQNLRTMRREDLISLHRDYGMGVRNSLGLWGQSPINQDPEVAGLFPDDISQHIIERMWEKLQSDQA